MRRLAALVLGALALGACETDFDPVAASNRVFSLYGVLDASADTQWVRVEEFARTAVRDTSRTGAAPLDAEVALLPPEGSRVPMAQRVVAFGTGPARLLWTTAPIRPGATYRVEARRPDGAAATATVAIPDTVGVMNEIGALREADRATVLRSELTVAIGTADWPTELVEATLEARVAYLSPDIENGVGFVGGVVTWSRRFSWGAPVNPDVSPFPCGRPLGWP